MLPFTLLAVFLIDGDIISFVDITRLFDVNLLVTIFYYYIVIIAFELVLRFFSTLKGE